MPGHASRWSTVDEPESPLGRRTSRNLIAGATVLALLVGWLALARPSGHPSVRPSPGRSPISSYGPSGSSLAPVFAIVTIAHVRVGGHKGDIAAYREPAGNICVQLTTEGTISCDFVPRPGQAVRLAYANWLYLDLVGAGFGMFLAGANRPPSSLCSRLPGSG